MKSKYYAIDENNKVIWAGDHIKYVKSKVEEDIGMTAHIYGWEALGDEFFTMAAARVISGRRIVAAYYYRKGWETASGPASAGMLGAIKSYVEKWEKSAEQIQMDFNARKMEERPETISEETAPETVPEAAALPVEVEEKNCAPVEIYLADREKKTLSRLGVADNKKGFFEIMQYLLDGMKEKFDTDIAVKDTFSGNFISAKWIRENYGLRARTFDERMENVQTWTEPETAAQAEPEVQEERPEIILNDKEEEETMKTETAAIEERPEIIPETANEMKRAREAWKAARLAEIRESWRPHVETILAAYPVVYSRLYEADGAGTTDYSEEAALFDTWMKTPIWNEFIGACARVRGDCFMSDRETAAFVIACRETREARKAFTVQEEETSAPAADERPETISSETAPEAGPKEKAEKRTDERKAARGPVKPKDFTAEALTGRGWCIVFDSGMNRTRVIVQDEIRETVAPIIKEAGFWWSDNMKSYNKKLSHKAHRAAIALAERLREVVAG